MASTDASKFNVEEYYKSLLKNLPIDAVGVYVKGSSDTVADFLRGKGLYTSKPVEEGELIFCERKVFGVVENSSTKFVDTCEFCMRPLGSLEDQIKKMARILNTKKVSAKSKGKAKPEEPVDIDAVLADLPYKADVLAYVKARVLEFQEAENDAECVARTESSKDAWPLPDDVLECTPVPCEYGSGEVYCSETCRDKAYDAYMQVFVDTYGAATVNEEDEEDEEDEDEEVVLDEDDLDAVENVPTPASDAPATSSSSSSSSSASSSSATQAAPKSQLIKQYRIVRAFARKVNPLFLLALKAMAHVLVQWKQNLFTKVGLPANLNINGLEVLAAAMRALRVNEAAPDVTTPEQILQLSGEALFPAIAPLLLFSQAPWWLQVYDPAGKEHNGQASADHEHSHSHGGHTHSHGGSSHGHSHGDGEDSHYHGDGVSALQSQLIGLLDALVRRSAPIVSSYICRVEAVLATATGGVVANFNKYAPEVLYPIPQTDEQLAAFVNDTQQRFEWYAGNVKSPMQLVNIFTMGCFMGMFEMNNIGTAAKSAVQDYMECTAGEMSGEDLEDYYERLINLATTWETIPDYLKEFDSFTAYIRKTKLALKKLFGATRWNNLLRRNGQHPSGTGLYAIACCMNHSCEPNVAVVKYGDGRDDKSAFIALRDIAADEELCISYIENEDNLTKKERQDALKDYLFTCTCSKCSRVTKKVVKKVAKK